MRVAVVVKSLQIGGMERAAINLAETFSNEGHESHLIYFKPKDKELSVNSKVHKHLFHLEHLLKLTIIGFILRATAKLINIIIRYSYFVMQGYMLSPIFNYKMKKLEKEYGEFDLIIVRGQGTFEMIWRYNSSKLIIQQVNVLRDYKSHLNNFFQKLIFSNKKIVCNAPAVYKELTDDFKRYGIFMQWLKVIPSPINQTSILERAKEFTPDMDIPYIVNIGRLVPVKNLSLLINAYTFARNHLELKHHLVIVGSGNLKKTLEAQVHKSKMNQYVHFTGALKNPYPWLSGADLFAFTSKNEGLPNVLLEALACHTPIISTRGRGGTLDIMSGALEKNLTDFNVEEFAQKMVSVLNEKKSIDYEKQLETYLPSAVVSEYLHYVTKDESVL